MSNLSIIHRLYNQKKIDCPKWLPDNMCYLTLMGSRVYGCHNNDSDYDYYGFVMPPRDTIFPHEYGLLVNFDDIPKFDQYLKENFIEQDSGKNMSFTIYGIVRYTELLAHGNPNVVETLFTNREHVSINNTIAEKYRNNRSIFLSKQSFYKTRSYAFAQMAKLKRVPVGKRLENYEKFGFDTKYSAHLVRLIDNCEQILLGDIDLQRNKEMVKAIRNGEWKLDEVERYAALKEVDLVKAVSESKLPEKPNMNKIRTLLLECIENHYGSIEKSFINPNKDALKLLKIKEILDE